MRPLRWLVDLADEMYLDGSPKEMLAGRYGDAEMSVLHYNHNGSRWSLPRTVHLATLALPTALPPLSISPESRVNRLVFGRGREAESAAFNRRFRVICPDERFTSAVIHPRMMHWMLENPSLRWRLYGAQLVSWGDGELGPEGIRYRMAALQAVIDLIPPYVFADYGEPPS